MCDMTQSQPVTTGYNIAKHSPEHLSVLLTVISSSFCRTLAQCTLCDALLHTCTVNSLMFARDLFGEFHKIAKINTPQT